MASSFESRSLVNAGMLRQFPGQLISIMLRVEDVTPTSITTISTDNHTVRVSLRESLNARKSNWVEVIGKPAGNDAVIAKEVIVFSENEDFDEEGYNMMVQFMNHCKDIYRQG